LKEGGLIHASRRFRGPCGDFSGECAAGVLAQQQPARVKQLQGEDKGCIRNELGSTWRGERQMGRTLASITSSSRAVALAFLARVPVSSVRRVMTLSISAQVLKEEVGLEKEGTKGAASTGRDMGRRGGARKHLPNVKAELSLEGKGRV
jgi:hypothetical protein